jgi:DNA-binding LacI/PurR family transcriptional regulator
MRRQGQGPPKPQVPVTIRAVAERANVSLTTVSHALSGKGRVGAATRERVMRAVEELGYVANRQARALKTGQTMTLLAVLPSTESAMSTLHSAFVADILLGAADKAIAEGYLVTVAGRATLADNPGPLSSRYDGAIIVDPSPRDPLIATLHERGVPVVTIGRLLDQQQPTAWVDNDYSDGVLKVLRHLHEAGFERPALLTTRQRVSYSLASIAAFKTWATATGGAKPLIQYVNGYPNVDNGSAATRELLASRDRPDAIIATTEPLSVGALRATQTEGLTLPDDIGLASINDSERLRAAATPVTALDLRATEVGRSALELLVSLLEDPQAGGERFTVVTTDLVVRRSTRRTP